MNVYNYIAQSNPHGAKAVCHSLGYKLSGVNSADDLGSCLAQIVEKEGEPAFRKIMEQHPDKEVICELFAEKAENKASEYAMNFSGQNHQANPGCGCANCNGRQRYMNFDGYNEQMAMSAASANNTNVFLVASALILAVAIISKNK